MTSMAYIWIIAMAMWFAITCCMWLRVWLPTLPGEDWRTKRTVRFLALLFTGTLLIMSLALAPTLVDRNLEWLFYGRSANWLLAFGGWTATVILALTLFMFTRDIAQRVHRLLQSHHSDRSGTGGDSR